MSNGGKFNYKFGTKNQWRRTIWNRIDERLQVHPRDAVVLYLAGLSDIDRQIAMRHGFRDKNLIAIDFEKSVVEHLRGKGVLAVDAALSDVLTNWSGLDVHVVYADLCCGILMESLSSAVAVSCNHRFKDAVVMFNLMRGRDWMRAGVVRCGEETIDLGAEKHRARAVFKMSLEWNKDEALKHFSVINDEWSIWRAKTINDYYEPETFDAEFLSYMSDSGQMFDSGVWWNTGFPKIIDGINRDIYDSFIKQGIPLNPAFTREVMNPFKEQVDLSCSTARKILALRATRTRQLQAA